MPWLGPLRSPSVRSVSASNPLSLNGYLHDD